MSTQTVTLPGKNASLRSNTPFLLLWLGHAISFLGDFFGTTAQSVLVYTITGSKVAMGSLWVAFLLPQVAVRLLGGPIIDRVDRRKLMWVSDLARAAGFAVPAVLYLSGTLQIWHLFVSAAVTGMAGALFQPALMAFIPEIVPAVSLRQANALLEGTANVMALLGPALGTATIQWAGPGAAMFIDAASFAISAITLAVMLIPKEATAAAPESQPFAQDLFTGFRFFARHGELVWLAASVSIFNLFWTAVYAQFLPYVTEQLGSDLIGLGLLDSFASLGGILGTFVAGFVGEMKRRSAFTMASLALGGVLLAGLGLVHHLWLALILAVLTGLCSPFFNINSAIIYQSLVPDKLRGRVFTVRLLLSQGTTPLGAFLGGIIAQTWGLPPLFIISGLVPAAMAVFAYLQPALRRIDGDLVPIQE